MHLFTGEPLDNGWRAWWRTNPTIWFEFDYNYFMLTSISDYFAAVYPASHSHINPKYFQLCGLFYDNCNMTFKASVKEIQIPKFIISAICFNFHDGLFFLSSMLNLFSIFVISSAETLGYRLLYALPVCCQSGFYGRPKLFSLVKILFSFPLIIPWALITTSPAHRKHKTDAYSPQSDIRVLYLREFADCTLQWFDLARVHTVHIVRFNLFFGGGEHC